MQNPNTQTILIFIIVCSLLILLLISFIAIIIYRYQKKQHTYFHSLEELKAVHQNTLLRSQLEIQEQTFQNISREIHDSIGQKLTLAKLHLNTLDVNEINGQIHKINNAVKMIGEAINDLSDISRSMSSELVLQNGLIKGLEFEAGQLSKIGLYKIKLTVSGKSVFLDSHFELVLFRIVQEALNNIVKHSAASQIDISLNFASNNLNLQIRDNGKGFTCEENSDTGIGLRNMYKRAKMLGGHCSIESGSGTGTVIIIQIPINEYKETI